MQTGSCTFDTPGKKTPAWLLSLILHVSVCACLFLFAFRVTSGSATIENKKGGIVLVDRSNETTEYLDEGDLTERMAAESQAAAAPALMSEELPPSLPGLEIGTSEITGVGEAFTDSLTGADSMTLGKSSGQNFGGQVTTEVFGVKGTGSRFVYVFDRSASMEDLGGKPLRAAKRSLLESLSSLGEVQQFQIIFYNVQTKIYRGSRGAGLAFATDDEKKTATRFVESIAGEGGTDHLNALRKALAFGPDVVFLLTDAEGGFNFADLSAIRSWNTGGSVINAIEFGIGRKSGDDYSLQRVAEQSGGQYTYKDVRSFRER